MRRGLIAAAIAVGAFAVVGSTAVAKTEGTGDICAAAVHERLARLSGAVTGWPLSWVRSRFPGFSSGSQKYSRENGTRFKVVHGDTQLKAPVAGQIATQLVADRRS